VALHKTVMRPLVIGVFGTVAAGYSATTKFLCTVGVRFAAAARFKSPCKSCVSQVQSPHRGYRRLMVTNTDCLWVVIPIGYGQSEWNIPIPFGQFYR